MSIKQVKSNIAYTIKALTEEVKSFGDIDLVETYQYYKERENHLCSLETLYMKVLMKEIRKRGKVCPKCKETYLGYPAISRVDNETEICQECGQREALSAWIADRYNKGCEENENN